jgi:glycosyltransferase involved in cell wall biosynthesis
MDIGLMPTDSKPFNQFRFSRKVWIYSCAGVPTLATDLGLNREAVLPEINGLLYLHKDATDFTEKALKLLNDDSYRVTLGQSALQHVKRYHDLPRVAEQFVSAIIDLCQSQKESPSTQQRRAA